MTGMDRIRSQRGLMAKIARELGITRGAIKFWRVVPAERVGRVAEITGIPAAELRPDLADVFREQPKQAA